MRLTSFTDYGLRAMMLMAGTPERTFTTQEIARTFDISQNHLTKIVRRLVETGFLKARRGWQGGIQLAQPPEEITVGKLIRALEDPCPIVECFRPDGGQCPLVPTCLLKGRLARARDAFLAELDRTSLAEIRSPLPQDPQAAVPPPA